MKGKRVRSVISPRSQASVLKERPCQTSVRALHVARAINPERGVHIRAGLDRGGLLYILIKASVCRLRG